MSGEFSRLQDLRRRFEIFGAVSQFDLVGLLCFGLLLLVWFALVWLPLVALWFWFIWLLCFGGFGWFDWLCFFLPLLLVAKPNPRSLQIFPSSAPAHKASRTCKGARKVRKQIIKSYSHHQSMLNNKKKKTKIRRKKIRRSP